jgi:signal peptide peptidase SppA
MKQYPNLIKAIASSYWAILPEKMEAIIDFLNARFEGNDAALRKVSTTSTPAYVDDGVGILSLDGTISQKMGLIQAYSGGTSTDAFALEFRKMEADPSVKAIVIEASSPGGNVYGVSELSNIIRSSEKRVYAAANSLMASAAYWIASAADKIYVTPGGEIGSVGVLAVHTDISQANESEGRKVTIIKAGKYKAEGNPYEPLNDESTAELQKGVDRYYDMFVKDVAAGRRASVSKVRSDFGQGRLMSPEDAVSAGMADGVMAFSDVMSEAKSYVKRKKNYDKRRAEINKLGGSL